MPNVFEYTDYRKYLSDWLEWKKNTTPSFSYTIFANKAGFKDRGFLHNVIHCKRDLTKVSLVKVSRAMGHEKEEAEYFENLIFFNKAVDIKDKNYFFEKLKSVKSTNRFAAIAQEIRNDQYDFYSKWYHSAVRSLIDMHPFKNNYHWLAKNIFPPITPGEAKKSVQLLERLGLIELKDENYRLTSKSITSGNEVTSLAVHNFHKEAADLAKNALDSVPPEKRNFTGLTLGISQKTYSNICEEIQQFRQKIIQIVEQDEDADRTYQLTFNLFPMTSTDIKIKENL